MNVTQLGRQQAWHRLAASLRPIQRQTLVHHIYEITPPAFRTRPASPRSYHSLRQPTSQARTRISSNISRTRRRWNSSSAEGDVTAKAESQLTFSQRMKKLSREYGWTAVGVYFALSVLDFPFCFLAVRLIGTDTIGHWEHVIVQKFKAWIPWLQKEKDVEAVTGGSSEDVQGKRALEEDDTYEVTEHGYKEAEKANAGSDASIWTQLALAYAVHKSFIFIRVPLTAAVLPKVVKTLRGWGYNIGKRTPKQIDSAKGAVKTK